jgi:two-component system, OmpR family, sensor histidine kinase BaeS
MKMSITYRLFFLILCATGLAIIFLLLIMWWNIHQGFFQYLGTVDQKKLAQIVDDLGKKYEQQGNWDFLKHTPPRWDSSGAMPFLHPGMDHPPLPFSDENPPMGPPPELEMNRPPFPPQYKNGHDHNQPKGPRFGEKHPPDPLVILNADKEPIHGFYPPNEKINLYPIVVHGNTAGYVGILSPRHFLDPMQIRFLSQQKLALLFGAAGIVLIVIIISFPLARRLVKPIRAMAAATHDIASGKYTTRISFSSTDELGQLARDFNAMALTLEKHEKERRQWVADISHELRTPIAVLQGEIEALLDGIHNITPEMIRSLHAETLRLKRLVEDLYQLSLSDLGALTYRKENLDIVEALKDSIEVYRAEFDRTGIALKTNINRDIKAIGFADRERLRQLFANLLENSLRYTDTRGTLEIGAKVNGDSIMIEFQDSKPGVSAQDMERLFDRFYRVEGSRNRTLGGAGLGLTISKKIVDAHEGIISAHSSSLGGVLIRISLPVFGGRK